jgi:hypothetical protein
MTANNIATAIAALIVDLDNAVAAHKAACSAADAAADAVHGDAAADDSVDLDAWAEVFEATFAESNGAALREQVLSTEKALFVQGLALANECARMVRRSTPADVVAMYEQAIAGKLMIGGRDRLIAHLRDAATKTYGKRAA